MMYRIDYATFQKEGCEKLEKLGFKEDCEYVWALCRELSDKIVEKYPGLSDDGYLELTKEYGGMYTHDEVYPLQWNLVEGILYKDFVDDWVNAPGLEQITEFIQLNYGIDAAVTPVLKDDYKSEIENGVIKLYNSPFDSDGSKSQNIVVYAATLKTNNLFGGENGYAFDLHSSLDKNIVNNENYPEFCNALYADRAYALATALKTAILIIEKNKIKKLDL